jgi:hypothetical protein
MFDYATMYLKYTTCFGGMFGMMYSGKIFYSIGVHSNNHTIFDRQTHFSIVDYWNGIHFAMIGMVLGGAAGAIIMPFAFPLLVLCKIKTSILPSLE